MNGLIPTREELLAALEAVRDAIAIPHAATVGDAEIRAQILDERLISAVVFLDHIVGPHVGDYPVVDIPWSISYLREQLAKHPAEGYKIWEARKAELEAERQARSTGGAS